MNLSKPIILQTIKPIGRMVSAFAPRCQTLTKVLQDLCLHRIQHLTDMALNLYLLWGFWPQKLQQRKLLGQGHGAMGQLGRPREINRMH